MTVLCKLLGHKTDGDPIPVFGDGPEDKWQFVAFPTGPQVYGYVLYYIRICQRCGYRVPATADDAAKKAAKTAEISRVMNGERARYGLRPISWDL